MKCIITFLLMIMTTTNLWASSGNIGTSDNRERAELSDELYNSVCKFLSPQSICTCGFIDEHLIITNAHCVASCNQRGGCSAEFWNANEGRMVTTQAHLITYGDAEDVYNGHDWAILSTDDGNPKFLNVSPDTPISQIHRGGFGTLRIIEDWEVVILRRIVEKYRWGLEDCLNKYTLSKCVDNWIYTINEAAKESGLEPLTGDTQTFKVQECSITNEYVLYGKDVYDNMVQTNCDSSSGDSGAPLFVGGNTLVAVNNAGPSLIIQDDDDDGAVGVKSDNFYDVVQSVKNSMSNNSNTNAPSDNGNNDSDAQSYSDGNDNVPTDNNGNNDNNGGQLYSGGSAAIYSNIDNSGVQQRLTEEFYNSLECD